MAIDSWSLVRVFGTWVTHAGVKLAGKYRVTIPARLTNSADDLIIPAGVFAQGDLVVAEGVPSLSLMVPATDDPDIQQDGWLVTVEVSFSGAQVTEPYAIEVPIADQPIPDGGTGAGVNLRTIALSTQMPPQAAMYGVGRPLGLALLSEDGLAVLDADGNPIESGGGVSSWDDLEDKPAVIAAGADAAAARTAIGAQPAGTYLTSLPDATASAKGAVELATTAEAVAGSDAVRAVTPAGLKAAVDALVSGAPGALDTLSELAAALGGDAAFSTTVASALANRVRADIASQGLTATQQGNARTNVGLADAPVVLLWSGTGWRRPGGTTDLAARPTTGPLQLIGGTVANRPAWANQPGDMVMSDLANLPPGATFQVSYDGTSWRYAGATVTARPSSRTDLVMQCVNAVNATVPSWAIAGDQLLRVG